MRMAARVIHEHRFHAREHLEALGGELIERGLRARSANERGALDDAAREKEVVGAAARHGDAHAGAVDVVDRLDRRVRRHEIAALDDDVGVGEFDVLGPLRIARDEGDVPAVARRIGGHLAGRLVGTELERHAEPPGELARKIDRDAA